MVTASNGFTVRLADNPAAITTIIVSPIALDIASKKPPTIPGNAAGKTTFLITSDSVEPSPRAPSLIAVGTALMASSDNDDINGIIIIPITIPAANALSDATLSPTVSPQFLRKGASVRAAKNPYTTVGIPARTSRRGFAIFLNLGVAY